MDYRQGTITSTSRMMVMNAQRDGVIESQFFAIPLHFG
jgi:hypothetical protein